MRTLQKFSSVHDQVRNHFNLERYLLTRPVYKQKRLTALDEWRGLAASALLAAKRAALRADDTC